MHDPAGSSGRASRPTWRRIIRHHAPFYAPRVSELPEKLPSARSQVLVSAIHDPFSLVGPRRDRTFDPLVKSQVLYH